MGAGRLVETGAFADNAAALLQSKTLLPDTLH